ncbi:P-loop NTPase family protein [Paenibacillus roseipurpureus]|uniref:AAA domain-containing protein n=1 Tax=Paenibacillus roseopurpureus TaxID=2918901 RepID=A0AA96LIB8_9BACL|nr:hypothetical protein [Paenibacillus sp. MBLB1832]WNR42257.1 hypothetical protein MJB10_14035 [Paenibacillus sp. MBLB1832]
MNMNMNKSKIHVYILDDDRDYILRLTDFIRSTAFAEQLYVKLFSKPELLLQLSEDSNIQGILLLSESYYPLFQHHRTSLSCMFLSQNIANSNTTDAGHPFLFRFQPLQSLVSRLITLYMKGSQFERRPAMDRKTQVISVFSASGHIGKSITAIHMAKQLAFRGERVFYLSLENVSAASQWLQGETGHMSQLLYYVKTSPALVGAKLGQLKSHDARLRFDFLTPHEQMREMQEMNGEHIRELLHAIIDLAAYDTIILDLESSVHPRILKSLEMSDTIVWLLHDDWQDAVKTRSMLKQMSDYPHIHFVMTQWRGKTINDFDFLGKKPTYQLPYMPEWKTIHAPEQIWQSDLFAEQVAGMLHAISQQESIFSFVEGGRGEVGSTAVS